MYIIAWHGIQYTYMRILYYIIIIFSFFLLNTLRFVSSKLIKNDKICCVNLIEFNACLI